MLTLLLSLIPSLIDPYLKMNALKRKARSLVDSAMKTASGPKSLLNFDSGTPGRRVWPLDNPRKNAEWEIRLDAGQPKITPT